MEKKPEIQNFCTTFVLPMCDINHKFLPRHFFNSYIREDFEAILVFKKLIPLNLEILNFIDAVKFTNPNYITMHENNDEIILFFNIPEKYRNDFILFMQGSYSQFSVEYKKVLTEYYGKKTVKENYTVTEYNTIYPETFKRKQIAQRLGVDPNTIIEVLDAPNLADELYKSNTQLKNTLIYDTK